LAGAFIHEARAVRPGVAVLERFFLFDTLLISK